MRKIKPITEKLSTQEKIDRALRIVERRKEQLKALIEKGRRKKVNQKENR